MASSDLNIRIDSLEKEIESLAADVTDENLRKKLLSVIQKARSQVESPVETIWRMIMSPHAPTALMVLIRMGVVKDLVAAGGPKTAKELVESCGGNEIVIGKCALD